MRSLVICAFALSMVARAATAGCIGSDTFKTCTDASGNSYTVNKMGNLTQMNGYNAQTGSQWNQTSQHLGNMTFHNGTTNGQSWNMTEQDLGGGMRTYNGTNSAGQPFSHFCTKLGGCD